MKRALITGGTGAIGTAIVRNIINSGVYSVALVGRSKKNGQKVINEIASHNPEAKIEFYELDVSSHSEVVEFARNWKQPLDLIINAAAIAPPKREETSKGIEKQFATNVLGYYWMMEEFGKHMNKRSRIINVASYWAGNVDLSDVEFKTKNMITVLLINNQKHLIVC